jgi:hypothetical protein
MITKKKLREGLGATAKATLAFSLAFSLSVWVPALAVAFLPIWPEDFSWLALFAFFGVSFAAFVAWNLALSYSGIYRWMLYRVWRPGRRPCLCDVQRAYCFRHNSSPREANRPGVVSAKLKERDS